MIYARLSVVRKTDDKQEQSDSVENQIAALSALAAREGYECVDTYVDDGKSGYTGVERPGFLRLLSDLSKDKFDRVLVRHDDRLARNDEEATMFRVACARFGVTWQNQSGAITNPATAEGNLLATVTAGIAQYESQVKRERLLSKYDQMRQEGTLLPQGFGWYRGGKKNPEQAEHVTWMFEHLAAGGSTGAIVRRMNDLGVVQMRGGIKWQHGTISSILDNPRVAGLVPDRTGTPIPGKVGTWDALVSPDLYFAAQAARRSRAKSTARNNFSTRHLLGGIAECGVCGLPLRSNGNADERTGLGSTGTYRCTYNRHAAKDGRRHVSARVDELDLLARKAIVDAFVFGTGNLLPEADEEVRSDLAAINVKLAALGVERSDLLANLRDPSLGLTITDIRPNLRAIQEQAERLEAVRQQLLEKCAAATMLTDLRKGVFVPGERVSFEKVSALRAALRARLSAMHIERQRELVRHFLAITVMPGRGATKYVIEHKVVTSLNEPSDDAWTLA